MIDCDAAELMAMIEEFLAATRCRVNNRTPARTAAAHRHYRLIHGMTQSEIPNMPEDYVINTDETPIDDVLHSGVIGTEE